MYNVSNDYIGKLHSPVHTTHLSGTIGSTSFTEADVLSLTITNQSADTNEVSLGSVYTAELRMTLRNNFPISRTQWLNSVITVSEGLKINSSITEYVPLGVFTISECTFTLDGIEVTAYDSMIKFDKGYSVDSTEGTPYMWLKKACNKCNVALENTEVQIEAMTNGTAVLSMYANNDIETYRDLISWISATLGGFATINRTGKLEIRHYGIYPVDELTDTMRFNTCNFAGYDIHYTGLSVLSEADQSTIYYHVTPDNGSVYNMGANPFLQGQDTLAQNIIDAFSQIELTPFKASMLNGALYDLGDCISFTGGIAGGVYCGVMKYSYTYNAGYTIEGYGKDPALASARSKTDKNLSGLYSSVAKEVNQLTVIGNESAVSLAESVEESIITYNFEVLDGNNLTFMDTSIVLNTVATETLTDNVYTLSDIVASLRFYVDGTWINLNQPEYIVDEGKDTIVFTGSLIGLSAGPHVLDIRLRIDGGSGEILINDGKVNLYGYGITFEVYMKEIKATRYTRGYYIGHILGYDDQDVKAIYNNGLAQDVTYSCEYSPAIGTALTEVGDLTVGISYQDQETGNRYDTEYQAYVSDEVFEAFVDSSHNVGKVAVNSGEYHLCLYTGLIDDHLCQVNVRVDKMASNKYTGYINYAYLDNEQGAAYVMPNLSWETGNISTSASALARLQEFKLARVGNGIMFYAGGTPGELFAQYGNYDSGELEDYSSYKYKEIVNPQHSVDRFGVSDLIFDNEYSYIEDIKANAYRYRLEIQSGSLSKNESGTIGGVPYSRSNVDHSKIMTIGDYVIMPRVQCNYFGDYTQGAGDIHTDDAVKYGFAYATIAENPDPNADHPYMLTAHYVSDVHGAVYGAEDIYNRAFSEDCMGAVQLSNDTWALSKTDAKLTYRLVQGTIAFYDLSFDPTVSSYFVETLKDSFEAQLTNINQQGRIPGSNIYYLIDKTSKIMGLYDADLGAYEELEWESTQDDFYKTTIANIRLIAYHPEQERFFYAYTDFEDANRAFYLAFSADLQTWTAVEGVMSSTITGDFYINTSNMEPWEDDTGDYFIIGGYVYDESTPGATVYYRPSVFHMFVDVKQLEDLD